MALTDLTANHVGNPTGGFEGQRANNGLLLLSTGIGDLDNLIKLSLLSFPIPKNTSNVIEVPYLNETRKFLGKPVFENITIVVKDYVDKDTAKLIHQWRRKAYDPATGKIGFAKDYKKNGKVVLYSPEGSIERKYTLEGIAPASFDPGEVDMGSDEIVNLTLDLTVDKTYYDL